MSPMNGVPPSSGRSLTWNWRKTWPARLVLLFALGFAVTALLFWEQKPWLARRSAEMGFIIGGLGVVLMHRAGATRRSIGRPNGDQD